MTSRESCMSCTLNNGGASHAFISEVAKTAVAGKNIVIPDYVTYNGKKISGDGNAVAIFSPAPPSSP